MRPLWGYSVDWHTDTSVMVWVEWRIFGGNCSEMIHGRPVFQYIGINISFITSLFFVFFIFDIKDVQRVIISANNDRVSETRVISIWRNSTRQNTAAEPICLWPGVLCHP